MTTYNNIHTELLEFILPEGILDHFFITDFKQEESGQKLYTKRLTIYLEEKDIIPDEYSTYAYKSSGFVPPKSIKDCPIRRNLVTLVVKCRRWDVFIEGKNKKCRRNWNAVAKGTRLSGEYASFLKGIGGL